MVDQTPAWLIISERPTAPSGAEHDRPYSGRAQFPIPHSARQQSMGGKDAWPIHFISSSARAGPLGIQMCAVRSAPNQTDRQFLQRRARPTSTSRIQTSPLLLREKYLNPISPLGSAANGGARRYLGGDAQT